MSRGVAFVATPSSLPGSRVASSCTNGARTVSICVIGACRHPWRRLDPRPGPPGLTSGANVGPGGLGRKVVRVALAGTWAPALSAPNVGPGAVGTNVAAALSAPKWPWLALGGPGAAPGDGEHVDEGTLGVRSAVRTRAAPRARGRSVAPGPGHPCRADRARVRTRSGRGR